MLMHPDPECRPSAAQILNHELLQSPHELHMKRELRRLEEKLKEVERQRDAALQSLASLSANATTTSTMMMMMMNNNAYLDNGYSNGFGSEMASSNNGAVMDDRNSSGTVDHHQQQHQHQHHTQSHQYGGIGTNGRGPSPTSSSVSRKSATPPPSIDASSVTAPTIIRASPNGFALKLSVGSNASLNQQQQKNGSPSSTSSSSSASFGSHRSSPVMVGGGGGGGTANSNGPNHTPSPTSKTSIALPLNTIPHVSANSSPTLFTPRPSLGSQSWRMDPENTRNRN